MIASILKRNTSSKTSQILKPGTFKTPWTFYSTDPAFVKDESSIQEQIDSLKESIPGSRIKGYMKLALLNMFTGDLEASQHHIEPYFYFKLKKCFSQIPKSCSFKIKNYKSCVFDIELEDYSLVDSLFVSTNRLKNPEKYNFKIQNSIKDRYGREISPQYNIFPQETLQKSGLNSEMLKIIQLRLHIRTDMRIGVFQNGQEIQTDQSASNIEMGGDGIINHTAVFEKVILRNKIKDLEGTHDLEKAIESKYIDKSLKNTYLVDFNGYMENNFLVGK